jgi:hypothetical protein
VQIVPGIEVPSLSQQYLIEVPVPPDIDVCERPPGEFVWIPDLPTHPPVELNAIVLIHESEIIDIEFP